MEDVKRLVFWRQSFGKFIRETKTIPMYFLFLRRRILLFSFYNANISNSYPLDTDLSSG